MDLAISSEQKSIVAVGSSGRFESKNHPVKVNATAARISFDGQDVLFKEDVNDEEHLDTSKRCSNAWYDLLHRHPRSTVFLRNINFVEYIFVER